MNLRKPSDDPPTAERIVLLGTGTCQLQEDRRASSVLVELDGLRLVFDLDGRFVRGDAGAVDTDEPELGLPFVN